MGTKQYIKKNGFVEKHIGDETVVVPLVGSVAQMEKVFSLNEVGSLIYSNLSAAKTNDELLTLVLNTFDVSPQTAAADLKHFLQEAVNKGIITVL
ncbi:MULTISPECIES: PqqD family protein [unclassified Carboxylicivirga]|uniref:PqqD family protein n=1 Tax=Carboxylicivirga TaxID=1628153 RepID=UPI003D337D2A